MGHAVARQRQFNPQDISDAVLDLAQTNPARLAKDVVTLARKKNSADGIIDGADHNTGMVFGTVGALVVTGLAGHFAGVQSAQRDAMVAEWEAQGNTNVHTLRCTPWEMGVKDPTIAFWKIPWLALAPLVAVPSWLLLRRRRRKATKGKKSIPGIGETFMFLTGALNGGLLLADALSNRSYCEREGKITSGRAPVVLAPTG